MPNFKKNPNPIRKNSPYKMKGYSYPGTAPTRKTTDLELGSTQEVDVEEGRVYVNPQTKVVNSPKMQRLLKNEPPKDSSDYAGWKKAFDTASAEFVASKN